ncbi:MAG: hypothetical protein Q9195_006874 [Heterodermia aff. obscurata]
MESFAARKAVAKRPLEVADDSRCQKRDRGQELPIRDNWWTDFVNDSIPEVTNGAVWCDGNATSAASETCYQAADPASSGWPYFWDTSQLQVATVTGSYDGSIQDQSNVHTMPSTYREYCFGMIYNVRAKILENASSCIDGDLPLSQESLIHLGLAVEKGCFILLSPIGDRIAVVNEMTGQILKNLLELETARMSAYLTVQAWNNRLSSEGQKSKKTYILVNLNIYGSSTIRDRVSRVLSLGHVYLQHPLYQDDNTSYDNPHFVEIHGVSPDEDALPDQSATEVIDTSQCGPLTSSIQLRVDEAVSEVLDSLTRLKRLSKLEAPCCIRTPLLEHQKEGLDFVAQRETGPVPVEFSLWQRCVRQGQECLKVTIYHGRGREIDPVLLADADIALTTYHTIVADVADTTDSESAIFRVKWFRIILDEAHVIRRMSTKLFRAASSLSSRYRWCLTGTPVQNRLEDIGSLVAFLGFGPLDNVADFKKYIVAPIMKGQGIRALRLLLDSICLRRTKILLQLPDLKDEYRLLQFSDEERKLYNTTEAEMSRTIKNQEMIEKSKRQYLGIFQLQLQLRRICDLGTFESQESPTTERDKFDPEETLATLREMTSAECIYCGFKVSKSQSGKPFGRIHFTTCGHLLCSECVPRFETALKARAQGSSFSCPLCSKDLTLDYLFQRPSRLRPGNQEEGSQTTRSDTLTEDKSIGVSSKASAVVHDVGQHLHEGKSIIFSCWTRSLDLVGKSLDASQIAYARLDGSQSTRQRQQVLDDFHVDPYLRVLIMTTGTGAVG